MNDDLKRFLIKIKFDKNLEYFKDAKVSKVLINKSTNIMTVNIDNKTPLIPDIIDALLNTSKNGFDEIIKIKVIMNYEEVNDDDIKEYFKYILKFLISKRPSLASLEDSSIEIDDNTIKVGLESEVEKDLFDMEQKKVLNKLNELGLKNINIVSFIDVEKKKINQELIKKDEVYIAPTKEEKIDVTPIIDNSPSTPENIIYGNEKKYNIVPLDNIMSEMKNISVKVYVFGIEFKEFEKLNLITLKISDNVNSMMAKLKFFKKQESEYQRVKKLIYENTWYKISGNVENDNFAHDLVLNVTDMEKIDSLFEKITDEEEEKRIELHAHTMMSQMDGVINVNDLIAQAKNFGHKAIAITDHNSLQSFPDAFNNRKKDGLKVLYGAELNVVNDDIDIVINKNNYNLLDQEYVVFDIETTGFNSTSDSIIEIGAVKINNGEITDRFDELINPKRHIPEVITELTHITDDMVKDCDDEESVVRKFLNWTGSLPMVAHNAKFDTSFIIRACKQYDIEEFKNTVADTMEISRILNPELSKHSLSALTKRYGIKFDESAHHRADYDAEGTALAFYKMCKILDDRNIETIDSLYDSVDTYEQMKFQKPFHITMLAKNQTGLKNLFKIISEANTTYLFKEPKVPRSIINENREGLLIGSGCVNGEMFNIAKTKSDQEIANAMKFYDFIEVNPPSICDYLIEAGRVGSRNEIESIIKKLINVASGAGKLVCATGDVHNLTKKDLIYRKIIINQKVPSLGFHPLYRDHIKQIPNNYFMTTKEMKNEFLFLNDEKLIKEIVITNPNKIADLIEDLQIIKDRLYTPEMENSDQLTRDMVYNKAYELYGNPLPKIVEERIEKELNGIISNGYSVLYLIAQKLVNKSNNDGYFVGSRGSVGSSFVATMMDITEVNGLPPHYLCPNCKKSIFEDDNNVSYSHNFASGYDLPDRVCECGTKFKKEGQDIPFATFLGFNAEKVPDIDLNFSGENQADAHNYTKVLFGDKNVYRAGTISTVAEKTAYGFVKGYAEDKGINLRSIEVERLAKGVTGVKRTTGQHPGGIIVIPRYMDVFDFTAYQYPADDINSAWYTTHFDFHAIHDNVLKLDILGHDDPTMLKYLKLTTGIDFMTIPFDDKKVTSLFNSPNALGVTKEQINCSTGTLGIPEFGTNFVIKMLEETKPTTFAELVKISGLSHGTDVWAGNARDLILNNTVAFKNIIGCRDDILCTLLNYNMNPSLSFKISEFVRKGRASKDPDAWMEYEKVMQENKIPDWFIGSCKKIKYMFPKAHATAYVMMGYRVAWYKVYYPIYYYANYLGIRCFDFDIASMLQGSNGIRAKIAEIQAKGYEATNKETNTKDVLSVALEMCERGFKFRNISLTKSDSRFFVIDEDKKSIYFPFRALDGLGDSVASKIIEERAKHEFISIEDFQNRCKINNTSIERLRTLGVLDGMNESNQLSLF